jgi:hypothetical protein
LENQGLGGWPIGQYSLKCGCSWNGADRGVWVDRADPYQDRFNAVAMEMNGLGGVFVSWHGVLSSLGLKLTAIQTRFYGRTHHDISV